MIHLEAVPDHVGLVELPGLNSPDARITGGHDSRAVGQSDLRLDLE